MFLSHGNLSKRDRLCNLDLDDQHLKQFPTLTYTLSHTQGHWSHIYLLLPSALIKQIEQEDAFTDHSK